MISRICHLVFMNLISVWSYFDNFSTIKYKFLLGFGRFQSDSLFTFEKELRFW
jgi:hypothetical protein